MNNENIARAIQEHLCSICDTKAYTRMELEYIKAEIELMSDRQHTDQLWKDEIFEIIDKHITIMRGKE